MRNRTKKKDINGQTAIEYMLLLAAVVAVTLVGFRSYVPRLNTTANLFFNRAAVGIMGEPNRCGDGICTRFERTRCPADCGTGGSIPAQTGPTGTGSGLPSFGCGGFPCF